MDIIEAQKFVPLVNLILILCSAGYVVATVRLHLETLSHDVKEVMSIIKEHETRIIKLETFCKLQHHIPVTEED